MIDFQKKQHMNISAYQKTKSGNSLCGDSYLIVESDHYTVCAVSDGLGSGEQAYSSSVTVMNVIKENHCQSVKKMVELCNEKLVAKRGVVLTIIKFDYREKKMHYSSVGNIGFVLCSSQGQVIRPMPNRGFLSGRKIRVKTEYFPCDSGSTFLMFSDGVKISGWKVENLTELRSKKDADQFIEEHVHDTSDDMTILIGQLH